MKASGLTKETIGNIAVTDRKFPPFNVGDTIAVSLRIKEGEKERLQVFQGDVIAMHKRGASSSFTVRKIGAHGIAVERIIPYYSPLVASIKVIKKGDVRRAKLYYVRDRVGKAARITEKVMTKEQLQKIAYAQEQEQAVKETGAQALKDAEVQKAQEKKAAASVKTEATKKEENKDS